MNVTQSFVMMRHIGLIMATALLILTPITQVDLSTGDLLSNKETRNYTSGQNSASDFAGFSDWSTSQVYVPNDAVSNAIVANNSVIGLYMGEDTAPDGSGSYSLRMSLIRSNQTNLSWFSEAYTTHTDYGTNNEGVISSYVMGDGNVIVALSVCNGGGTIQENQNSQRFTDPACESEGGLESDGPLVRIFGFSINQNTTHDLGSLTYSDCGKKPTSGGGSSGWNYEYWTPSIRKIAIYGNFSNFSMLIGHQHNEYSTTSTGPGWPSNDPSRCKINFNGTEMDKLPGSTKYALDHVQVVNGTEDITRIASNLDDLDELTFSINGTGVWEGRVVSNRNTNCRNLNTGATVSLSNFSITNSRTQPGIHYIPGKLENGSNDELALMDAVDCTIVQSYQNYVNLDTNSWTDENGFTKTIGMNNGGTAITQFGTTINRGVTYEVSNAPNGTLIGVVATSLTSSENAAANPWKYRGYEGWTSETGVIFGRDIDQDNFIDVKDIFPIDSTEWLDSDQDGYGNNGDSCPMIWGNSSFDRNGCIDSDGDTVSDLADAFINDKSQYLDSDSDGFGDNMTGNLPDGCPTQYGTSNRGGQWGCPDNDGDGWSNQNDAFVNDGSQWNDTDSDGFGDSLIGFQGDACPNSFGLSTQDRFGCIDGDLDGWSNAGDDFPSEPTQWSDRDFDGYGDNQSVGANLSDAFPGDTTQWNDTDGDGYGDNPYGTLGDWFPNDPNRWQDSDRDGVADEDDTFPTDATQTEDTDGDGYGDNPNGTNPDRFPDDSNEWKDTDGDGYGNNGDSFPNDGTQWNDSDADGHGDNPYGTQGDWFPNDPSRWQDSDQDGVADEDDAFVNENSQNSDQDGDGFGDNPNGTRADQFPNDPLEWYDSDGDGYGNNGDKFPNDGTQWNDTDEDGYGDNPFGTQGDWFPNDPSRWQDSDRDGVADQDDAFPNEITQWDDTDGDGYGDEATGNRGDVFPNDDAEWLDSDMDGLGDNADAFPFDPTQKVDADGDGMGDNPMGIGADKFPEDATQWGDIDGDGYGDNPNGTSPDAFITDATQWSDEDGDGYGDNPAGRLYDQFPLNPTQWLDEDGDGLGDNLNGTNADTSLNDFDNDGYNDSIDPLPKLASPGDLDNDGVLDVNDLFPDDSREWADYDGDGEGDNADTDDDNDGWVDTDEIRLGTDPFGSADVPIDSFEIVIPGTAVGLGAWDLIGMFGGIPLFMWIGFGFATRNGRTAKYEGLLREAQTRDELEDVARMWEYSLMLRMLGPHQGIRLERLRAELDDIFESQNQKLSSIESEQKKSNMELNDSTEIKSKSLPVIDFNVPSIDAESIPDEKGYEWHTNEQGISWYRNEGSNSEWQRFEA